MVRHSVIRTSLLFFTLSLLLVVSVSGQDAPQTNSLSIDRAAKPAEGDVTDTQPPPEQFIPEDLSPEAIEQMNAVDAKYKALQERLRNAVIEMRKTHTYYFNDEDRTPAAKQRYYDQRNEAQKIMNELFEVSVELLHYRYDHAAATFLVTMIKHRLERDIYDHSTLRAGVMMINAGMRLGVYVFTATARAAMAQGEVEMAKKIYESIDPKYLEDADHGLLNSADELAKEWEKEHALRRKEAEEDNLPRVKLVTTRGEVLIELYINQAPSTVANFIKLVDEGFYDGLDFYQVVEHLLAITGDVSGDGNGNTGKFLVDEHEREDARPAGYGCLVMAKLPIPDTQDFVVNSASCQFAILYLPLPSVGRKQTVFGRVIEGIDAIGSLRRVDPNKKKEKDAVVKPPDRILSAEVVRRPEKMPEIKYGTPVLPGQMQQHTHPHK